MGGLGNQPALSVFSTKLFDMKTTPSLDRCSAFFAHPALAALQQDYRTVLDDPRSNVVHTHAGNLGDLIYYLPVIKAMKALVPDKHHHVLLTVANNGQRITWRPEVADFISLSSRLTETVPYVSSFFGDTFHRSRLADYGEGPMAASNQMVQGDRFRREFLYPWREIDRKLGKELAKTEPLYQRFRPYKVSLCEAMFLSFGLDPDCFNPKSTPWLFPSNLAKFHSPNILVHRSPRYRSSENNWVYDQFYNSEAACHALTLGEDDPRGNSLMPSSYPPCFASYRSLSEMVDAVSACRYFVGNQSFPFAVAEALKKPAILEVSLSSPDCLIGYNPSSEDRYFRSNLFPICQGVLVSPGKGLLEDTYHLIASTFRKETNIPSL